MTRILSRYPTMVLSLSSLWLISLVDPVSSLPTGILKLCKAEEEILWQLMLYFTTNYISHAASVPATPGAKLPETFMWGVVALFLPFASLGRSLAMILRHIQFHGNNVEKAASQGAIVVVARTNDWVPDVDYEQEVYVQPPDDFDSIPDFSLATFDVRDCHPDICGSKHREHRIIDVKHYDLHGEFELPNGYAFAEVTLPFLSEIISTDLLSPGNIKLSMHQSWLKKCVSVAQLISASYAIYESRGDQLRRFGFAAYNFTVIPYAIMSLVNLIAEAALGEYPAIYVLKTPIMHEAKHRGKSFPDAPVEPPPETLTKMKDSVVRVLEWLHLRKPRPRVKRFRGVFDGAIGRLANEHDVDDDPSHSRHSLKEHSKDTKDQVTLNDHLSVAPSIRRHSLMGHRDSENTVCPPSPSELLPSRSGVSAFVRFEEPVEAGIFRMRIGSVTRRFKYVHPEDAVAIVHAARFVIGAVVNKELEPPYACNDEQAFDTSEKEKAPDDCPQRQLSTMSSLQAGTARVCSAVRNQWVLLYTLSFVSVMLLPYILIWVLTDFEAQCSTRAERWWTFAWLLADQAAFLLSLAYFFARPAETMPASTCWRPSYFMCCAVLSAASVGGMVQVGQMYLVDKGYWGACQDMAVEVCSR